MADAPPARGQLKHRHIGRALVDRVRPPGAAAQAASAPVRRTYDRTSGKSHPSGPPSDEEDPNDFNANLFKKGIPDDADASPATLATSTDRVLYKRTKAKHWSESYPLRMRRWIEHSMHDIASRIFCEVVVRVPMKNAGRDEVLGLVQPYGAVKYINSLDGAAAVRVPGSTEPLSPVLGAMDLGHSHIVRFAEGLDAVRCFLELNGVCIDPAQYNDTMQLVAAALRDHHNDDGAEEDAAEVAAETARIASDMSIANATKGKSAQDLIFITVDFFRLAFTDPASCGGVVARSALPIATGRTPKFKVRETGETPVSWLARRLAHHAEEAAHWHPIVCSHQPLTWEEFCTAANLAAFMLPTPTANRFYAATQTTTGAGRSPRRNVDSQRASELQDRRWEPSHWSVAAEAMSRANYDGDDLARLVDVSQTAEDLMRGVRHKTTVGGDVTRLIYDVLNQHPLAVGVAVLFLVSFLIAVTFFTFVRR